MKRRSLFAALALIASVCVPTVASAQSIPFRTLTTNIYGVGGAATMLNLSGQSSCTTTVSGSFNATLAFRVSNDGTHWVPVTSFPDPGSGNNATQTITATGTWTSPLGSNSNFQVYATAYSSGIATVQITCGTGVPPSTGNVAVTNFPGTQTVALAGNATVVQSTGANLHITCDSGCGAAPPYSYSITTGTTASVLKTGSGTFAGAHNLATATQTAGMTCAWYDNTAASGNLLYQAGPFGAGQIVTFAGGQGIKFTIGLTVQCTGGTPVAPGMETLWI